MCGFYSCMLLTIILSVVLYGCETWSLTLRVLENRILRLIFEPKTDENGERRRFYNKELQSLHHTTIIFRDIKCIRFRWAANIARMEESRGALKILTGKLTGKRPLGRPRRKWEDNVRIHLKEVAVNTRKE